MEFWEKYEHNWVFGYRGFQSRKDELDLKDELTYRMILLVFIKIRGKEAKGSLRHHSGLSPGDNDANDS